MVIDVDKFWPWKNKCPNLFGTDVVFGELFLLWHWIGHAFRLCGDDSLAWEHNCTGYVVSFGPFGYAFCRMA